MSETTDRARMLGGFGKHFIVNDSLDYTIGAWWIRMELIRDNIGFIPYWKEYVTNLLRKEVKGWRTIPS